MASTSYDAIIVGAGHNGLVCAAYLAKAGLKVCIVERRHIVGGACVTEEFHPGYRASVAAYNFTLLDPRIMLDLQLLNNGLKIIKVPPVFQPFPDGRQITLHENTDRMTTELSRFDQIDALNYAGYARHLRNLAPLIRQMMWTPPVPVSPFRAGELARYCWRNRGLLTHAKSLRDLMILSAEEYLRKWFSNDDVISILGFYVSMSGSLVKLDTPGTALLLIRSWIRDGSTAAGGWGIPSGGMGSVTQAIAKVGSANGLEIVLLDAAREILLHKGAATGVALQSGRVLRSKIVVSGADLRTTFQKLVDPALLPPKFRSRIEGFRSKGALFKINLALSRLPKFLSFDGSKDGSSNPVLVRIGPGTSYFATAHNDALNGRYSRNPIMVVQLSSAADPTLAGNGHVMGILAGYAPTQTKLESNNPNSEVLSLTLATLERYAPGISDMVLSAQILTPPDLESVFGLPGGHVHHGDMSLDQLFVHRPSLGYAHYRSPIKGLYLCGSATHPGGGVTGIPGHNAAQQILNDLKIRAWP